MILGLIGSIGYGASGPLLWLMFGQLTDSFTQNDFNLCSIHFDYISQMFCPPNIRLTQYNFKQLYKYNTSMFISLQISFCFFRKCNYTQLNITIGEDIQFSTKVQLYSIFIARMYTTQIDLSSFRFCFQ